MSIWTTIKAQVTQPPAIPVLSVGNLKGGVGKTTVVANLAIALAQLRVRVLAIDLDFQASLSVAIPPKIIDRREESDGGMNVLLGSSYDMFHDSRVTATGNGIFSDLSLVRTSFRLADIEDRLFAAFILRKYEFDPRFALATKLADERLANDFDIVIIDTPPRLTMASINALCASTHVLIPTALTPMSESGALTFAEYLKHFRKTLCPNLKILAVLPTLTRAGTLKDNEITVLRRLAGHLPGVEIWDQHFIPERQAIADNLVQQHAESREKFTNLANEIIGKLGLRANGDNASRGTYRSPQLGWARLPE